MTTCAKVGCTNQVQLPEHFCYEHPYETGRPEHLVVGKVAEPAEKALKSPKELAAELREAVKAVNALALAAYEAGLAVRFASLEVPRIAGGARATLACYISQEL